MVVIIADGTFCVIFMFNGKSFSVPGTLRGQRAEGHSATAEFELFIEYSLYTGSVQQVHCFKFPFIKYTPVVENAGQFLCFLECIYLVQRQGDMIGFTVLFYCLNFLRDKRALHVIINGQLLVADVLFFCILCESGAGSVKGEGKQFIASGVVSTV